MEIPAYSPNLNLIENVWALVKDELQNHYPKLYLMKGSDSVFEKVIEKSITHCSKLFDPKIHYSLAGLMINRIEAIIKADRWYTKY